MLAGKGATALLTILVMSGGVGYLLSLGHHLCWSHPRLAWLPYGINYRPILEEARKNKQLEVYLYGRDEPECLNRKITYDGAWRIVTGLWHAAQKSSKLFEGAIDRANTLSDLMHGAGTVFIGSFFVYIFWLWVALAHPGPVQISFKVSAPFFLFPLIFIVFHLLGYSMAKRQCQGFISTILLCHLTREWEQSRRALRIYTLKNDFET